MFRPSTFIHTVASRRRWSIAILFLTTLVIQGCQSESNSQPNNSSDRIDMPKITANDFTPLQQKRIFFMHQSIGTNLMDGVERLAKDIGIKIPLEKRDAASLQTGFNGNGLLHAYGGKNMYPETKIRSFSEQLTLFPENSRPDVAVMKFCFIDFDTDTDIDSLFRKYTENIEQLQQRYPDITFLHMTVPLMEFPLTFKARLKRLLGMSVWIDVTNAKREAFSQRIRDRYPANMIFDIALHESTHPNGQRESRVDNNQTIYGLVPGFTNDGSHLNEFGQRYVAKAFLEFLSKLPMPSASSPNKEPAG